MSATTLRMSPAQRCRPNAAKPRRIQCWTPSVTILRGATKCRAVVDVDAFEDFLLVAQKEILSEAQQLDGSGKPFRIDRWERSPTNPASGYGITCVLEDGDLLEKAAANVSVIRGVLSASRAQAMSSRGRPEIDPAGGQPYRAAALSLVFHAAHPYVPTLRADVRLFEVGGQCWFGGGCDLTPSYLFEEDAQEFHHFWRGVCDAHSPRLYPEYKDWCDRYFYIPARKEHRGVGGIFFDDVPAGGDVDAAALCRDVARGVLPSWRDIAQRRRVQPTGQEQRQWQLLRRGRYLEFNLLYDRGVRFGLDGGRVESIMVSAPPLIAWKYDVRPQPGSHEQRTLDVLASPRSWC